MRTRQKEKIEPDIPSFTITAKDVFAVPAVTAYRNICKSFGLERQSGEVAHAIAEIIEWQRKYPTEVHLPDHPHKNVNPPPGYFALLKAFVDWFAEHDGVADDFGRLNIVAQAEEFLEKWNERSEHP